MRTPEQSFYGLICIPPESIAALSTGDAYGQHLLMQRLFTKGGSVGGCVCWHASFAGRKGLCIRFVSQCLPDVHPRAKFSISVKPFPAALLEGERYQFSVRMANEQSISPQDGRRFNTYRSEHEIEEWFPRYAHGRGFYPQDFGVLSGPKVDFFRRNRETGERENIVFRTFEIKGELEVTDRQRFIDAVLSGIGKKRGYGMGLLRLSMPIL